MSELKGKFADVFGGLDALEADHEKFVKDNALNEQSQRTDDGGHGRRHSRDSRCRISSSGRSRDQRSVSRPENRGRKTHDLRRQFRGRKEAPGYKTRPDRWTHYDLSNVGDSQMNQQANSSAAFSFLRDIRSNKHQKTRTTSPNDTDYVASTSRKEPSQGSVGTEAPKTSTEELDTGGNIAFRKPSSKPLKRDATAKSIYKGTTLVMPEYQFGDKSLKRQFRSENTYVKKPQQSDNNSMVKLSHVENCDDSNEEDAEKDTTKETTNASFRCSSKKRKRQHIRKSHVDEDNDD